MFDGYDEVQDPQKRAVHSLNQFIKKYDKNRYVLSCRIAAYHQTFEGFTLVEVADFSADKIDKFVINWFADDPGIAQKCLVKLKASRSVMELATTPLLLTMLCVQFDEAMDFPENRVELYQEATQAL